MAVSQQALSFAALALEHSREQHSEQSKSFSGLEPSRSQRGVNDLYKGSEEHKAASESRWTLFTASGEGNCRICDFSALGVAPANALGTSYRIV